MKSRLMQKNAGGASIVSWGISNRLAKDIMNSPTSPRVLTKRDWSEALTHKEHLQRHMSSNRYDVRAANKLMVVLATKYNVYLRSLMIRVLVSNSPILLGCEAATTK